MNFLITLISFQALNDIFHTSKQLRELGLPACPWGEHHHRLNVLG